MTTTLRIALLAALATSFVPAVALGQATSPDSLLRRIELLEERVRELEALVKVEPSRAQPVPDSRKWKDLANWRQLRLGMKPDEVRKLLGEPERVDAGPVTWWRWPDAHVHFMDGKVSGWSEPSR